MDEKILDDVIKRLRKEIDKHDDNKRKEIKRSIIKKMFPGKFEKLFDLVDTREEYNKQIKDFSKIRNSIIREYKFSQEHLDETYENMFSINVIKNPIDIRRCKEIIPHDEYLKREEEKERLLNKINDLEELIEENDINISLYMKEYEKNVEPINEQLELEVDYVMNDFNESEIKIITHLKDMYKNTFGDIEININDLKKRISNIENYDKRINKLREEFLNLKNSLHTNDK